MTATGNLPHQATEQAEVRGESDRLLEEVIMSLYLLFLHIAVLSHFASYRVG